MNATSLLLNEFTFIIDFDLGIQSLDRSSTMSFIIKCACNQAEDMKE